MEIVETDPSGVRSEVLRVIVEQGKSLTFFFFGKRVCFDKKRFADLRLHSVGMSTATI
jgi:hypothetical protein